jgi:hypothetical protein
MDDDPIGWSSGVEKLVDAKDGWKLSGRNVDGRSRHEARNSDQGDEIDDETQAQDAHGKDEAAAHQCQSRSDDGRSEFRMFLLRFEDNVANQRAHNCHRPDCDAAKSF